MPRKSFFLLFLFFSFYVAHAQTYNIKVNRASGKLGYTNANNTWFRLWYNVPKVSGEPILLLKVWEDYNNMGYFVKEGPESIFLFSGKFTKKSTYVLLVDGSYTINNLHFRARAKSVAQRVQFADTLVTFDSEWQEFDFPQPPLQQKVYFVLSGPNTGLEVQMSVSVESHPSGKIRYSVVDTLGNDRATKTLSYPAGKKIFRLPRSLFRDYVHYDYPDTCTVVVGEERTFTVVAQDSLPVPPSESDKYYLCYNTDWPVCVDGRFLNALKPTPDLNPDLWEVSGDQYSGIRLRHVATGLYLDRVIRECHTCSYAILSEDGCRWHFGDHYGFPILLDDDNHTIFTHKNGNLLLYLWGKAPENWPHVNLRLVPADVAP